MTIGQDILNLIVKADTTGAARELESLGKKTKASLGDGGAAIGKALAVGVASGAVVAGAAITAFAVKGVSDFQNVALASGKFADATGLSVEEASKWLEVADHIG